MSEERLNFRPGVNLMLSQSDNRGGWSSSNLIRWRQGKPEKVGGWSRISDTVLAGIGRALHFWSDLIGRDWLAAGTNSNLYIEQGGVVTDITPAGFIPGMASSGATAFSLLVWSLDNFGQDLVAIPSGGTLYIWNPTTGSIAAPVATAPGQMQGGFVMMQQQIIMAYGCTPLTGGTRDPMLVRWCDQSDFTDWAASTTNQAGSYRLPKGNRIVGGLQTPNAAFLWTDFDVWAVNYIGFPLVFSFIEVGANCGLIAQKAVTVAGTVPYWMSDHGFFRMGGVGAEQLPCPVWDYVFKDLDLTNSDKCLATLDYHYSEVWFFFPSLSGATGEIDSYVKFNLLENEWDTGRLVRTAWTDGNRPGGPLAIDGNGRIQRHDVGVDADGEPMTGVFIESGYTDLHDGGEMILVNRCLPDAVWSGGAPQFDIELKFRRYPGDAPTTAGPFTVTPTTELVTVTVPVGPTNEPAIGVRAREVAVRLSSDTLGTGWRMGAIRMRAAPDGRGP